jgi:DNA-binding CsgD family transcriptional regulator
MPLEFAPAGAAPPTSARASALPAPLPLPLPPAALAARFAPQLLAVLRDGVVLLRAGGAVVYRNAVAVTHLDAADGLALQQELARLARLAAGSAAGAPQVAMVRGERVRLQCTLVRLPDAPDDVERSTGGPLVLAVLEVREVDLPAAEALRTRFGLTAREASVARLIAQGRDNVRIARKLGISVNTARHYTEAVLLKLAVPCRSAVAAALLGTYERTDEHPVIRPGVRADGR